MTTTSVAPGPLPANGSEPTTSDRLVESIVAVLATMLAAILIYCSVGLINAFFAGGNNAAGAALRPPAPAAYAGLSPNHFEPPLVDCRPTGDCPLVRVAVWEDDYQAFHRHLQLFARLHGGGYDLSHQGNKYVMNLPPDAARGLLSLHREYRPIDDALRFRTDVTSPGYISWASQWSRKPAITEAGDQKALETLSVRVAKTYTAGGIHLFVGLVFLALGLLLLVCALSIWICHAKRGKTQ